MSDAAILVALRSREGMMLYAARSPRGGTNYGDWYLTYGLSRGFVIPRSQVARLIGTGQIVEYAEGCDAAYTTPEERARRDVLIAEAEQRRSAGRKQSSKEYHRRYYQDVTKPKRARAKGAQ
jgi:hypothetical protein